jgi:glycoside/pentoside/hexuronide:cation symporter, GPH family
MHTRLLLQYALLSIPLAFAGLPIYVHVPHYYATHYGVSLTSLSAALLLIRFVDAFQDPFIGIISERLAHHKRQIIALSAALLVISFIGLFNVPLIAQGCAVYWMSLMLLLVYTSFSTIMINYYSASMQLGHSEAEQTRISSYREAFMLFGVMLAAIIPQLLTNHYGEEKGYSYFAYSFLPLCVICCGIAVRTIPQQTTRIMSSLNMNEPKALLKDGYIRSLLWLFFINSIPTAITSTLFLFFVEDVLHADAEAGQMLMLYFLCAAVSVVMWNKLAQRYDIYNVLMLAMLLGILSFIGAFWLSAGDSIAFYGICALSGIALGGDMVILPALYANALDKASTTYNTPLGNIGFSVWNFLSKLNLSLAAGIALPVLAWAEYQPQITTSNIAALSFAYALIPCAFKIIAILFTRHIQQQWKQS